MRTSVRQPGITSAFAASIFGWFDIDIDHVIVVSATAKERRELKQAIQSYVNTTSRSGYELNACNEDTMAFLRLLDRYSEDGCGESSLDDYQLFRLKLATVDDLLTNFMIGVPSQAVVVQNDKAVEAKLLDAAKGWV